MTRDQPPRGAHLVLLFTSALFAFPLVWMILGSLKPAEQIRRDPFSLLPQQIAVGNYAEVAAVMPVRRYLKNTFVLCAGMVAGTLISSSLVAYGLARLDWPGRDLCFGLVIATMLLPWHVTMIPRFQLLRELGLYNSLGALIVPACLGDAFSIFLLRQFFLTIPRELNEAARLDGVSEWGIFWRIIVPLSKPALLSVGLLQLIAAWNDFSGPLLYLSDPQKFPLAYGLEQFVSAYSDQTHLLLAAATIFTLPLILLFLFTQKAFVQGIVTTGLKG